MRKRTCFGRLLAVSLVVFAVLTNRPLAAPDYAEDNPPVGDPGFPAPDFPAGVRTVAR